jgi:amino acid permease
MILGDTFQGLLTAITGMTLAKPLVLLGLTGTILLPLCLLKNLSSLAPFSLLGSLGMTYTATAMSIRYFGKAYTLTGKFGTDLPAPLRPSFGSIGAAGVLNPRSAILIGMLLTAYMAHFNAPQFFAELKDNMIPRYLTVVSISFAVSVALFSAMAIMGFLTFGANCTGLILNNYCPKDSLMAFSKVAVALSLVFSYPLAFTGARNGIFDLLKVKNKTDNARFMD